MFRLQFVVIGDNGSVADVGSRWGYALCRLCSAWECSLARILHRRESGPPRKKHQRRDKFNLDTNFQEEAHTPKNHPPLGSVRFVQPSPRAIFSPWGASLIQEGPRNGGASGLNKTRHLRKRSVFFRTAPEEHLQPNDSTASAETQKSFENPRWREQHRIDCASRKT